MVEPGLGTHALPPQAARGLDMVVRGVQERFLAVEGPPGSFLHRARAHAMADHAAGPRVSGRGRLLGAEEAGVIHVPRVSARGRRLDARAAEAPRELRLPRLEAGEVSNMYDILGRMQEAAKVVTL